MEAIGWMGSEKLISLARDPDGETLLPDLLNLAMVQIETSPLTPAAIASIGAVIDFWKSWLSMPEIERQGLDVIIGSVHLLPHLATLLENFVRLPPNTKDQLATAVGMMSVQAPAVVETWMEQGLGPILVRLFIRSNECMQFIPVSGVLWPCLILELCHRPRRFVRAPLAVVSSYLASTNDRSNSRSRFLDGLLSVNHHDALWAALGGAESMSHADAVNLGGLLMLFKSAMTRVVALEALDAVVKQQLANWVLRDVRLFVADGSWPYVSRSLWGGSVPVLSHFGAIIKQKFKRTSKGNSRNMTNTMLDDFAIGLASICEEEERVKQAQVKAEISSILELLGHEFYSRLIKVMGACQRKQKKKLEWADLGKAGMIGVAFCRMSRLIPDFERNFYQAVDRKDHETIELYRSAGIVG